MKDSPEAVPTMAMLRTRAFTTMEIAAPGMQAYGALAAFQEETFEVRMREIRICR